MVTALVLQMLATLARVAALQIGVQLFRLHAERVCRTGSILVGLLVTATAQPVVPATGPPALALCFLGSFAYAVAEILRTVARLRFADQQGGFASSQVRLAVTSPSGNYVLRNTLDTGSPRGGPPTATEV